MHAVLAMLKHMDDIRKSAKERAARRWHNYAVELAFKDAQKEAAEKASKEPKPLSPADTIEQEKLIAEATTRFESKFIKEVRTMLEGHTKRNQLLYALSIKAQRKRLLVEKLRRLETRQTQVQRIKKDLFS